VVILKLADQIVNDCCVFLTDTTDVYVHAEVNTFSAFNIPETFSPNMYIFA